ncbi:hypothetical protein FV232_26970 [Methylobacterium sp. WL30]|uniref:hypothetical protein n=1 Tax=unclassified Methylobacterium TaxID=2615210 RepID=UPI0011CA61D0|nr:MULTISPECIES: hypothetical protein [unclassified Methylobacterium]TXN27648.1 hypothetical protein FV225_21730 [Methylobacterium sp. WL93]TXN49345.1 hypothetical protein FV227_16725 [Methylobacterium sp. WL119]TXN61545.1 hypothetical protein FV232_26970 [Methylobacterium sp. WL30]
MPIRPEHRFFYPIDWPQLSATIRFGRAGGACEGCGRSEYQRRRWRTLFQHRALGDLFRGIYPP